MTPRTKAYKTNIVYPSIMILACKSYVYIHIQFNYLIKKVWSVVLLSTSYNLHFHLPSWTQLHSSLTWWCGWWIGSHPNLHRNRPASSSTATTATCHTTRARAGAAPSVIPIRPSCTQASNSARSIARHTSRPATCHRIVSVHCCFDQYRSGDYSCYL